MKYKNIIKYGLVFILLISLFNKVYLWIYVFIIDNKSYFDSIILEIITIICLLFLIFKSKKIEASLSINFNNVFKYSLIFILFTSFFEKLCYLVFNIQTHQNIGFFQLIFNPINFAIIFTILLVFLILKIRKNKLSFNAFLIYILSFVILNYILKYGNDVVFYHINKIIHPTDQSREVKKGFELLMNFETLSHPSFNILKELIVSPISDILLSLKIMDIRLLVMRVLNSQFILSTIVIFYYSSYLLFRDNHKKGVHSLIPIKKDLIFLEISKKPTWWIILLLIPFIRIIPKHLINIELSKQYQKKNSFAYGMTIIPWFFYGKLILNKNTIANKS